MNTEGWTRLKVVWRIRQRDHYIVNGKSLCQKWLWVGNDLRSRSYEQGDCPDCAGALRELKRLAMGAA